MIDHTNLSKSVQRRFALSQEKIIIRNRCQCSKCLTIIESKTRHDFVQCACGRIFTDGGIDYIHRGFTDPDDLIGLDEFGKLPLDKPSNQV